MEEQPFGGRLRLRPPIDPVYQPRLRSGAGERGSGATARAARARTIRPAAILWVVVALLGVSLGAALLAGSQPAVAPSLSPASELLFDGGNEISAVALGDDEPRVVVDAGPGGLDGYVPSPDGRRLAFMSRPDEGVEVVVSDKDGARTVVARTAAAASLTWSADGTRLAYDSSVDPLCSNAKSNDGIGNAIDRDSQWGMVAGGGNDPSRSCDVDVYVVAPGERPVAITTWDGRDASPAWSPDGSRIAFVSDRDGPAGDIYTMAPDGTGVDRVTTEGGFAPVWSPDGTRIAYFDGPLFGGVAGDFLTRRLIVIDADGSDPMVVVGPSYAQQIKWSPDGRRLAYTVYGTPGVYQSRTIPVVDIATGEIHPLRTIAPGPQWGEFDPAWAPDGTSIAFTLATPGGHKWGAGTIAVAPADGGEPIASVTYEGRQPEWR